MKIRIARTRATIVALAAFLGTSAAALSCSVPVFRYALERWAPDPFQVYVFHRGPLTTEHQAALDLVRSAEPAVTTGTAATSVGRASANLRLHVVNVDNEMDAPTREVWDKKRDATLPSLVVRRSAPPAEVFSASLSKDEALALLDSPARRTIAQRLLNGETAAWIFLDGGDKARDDAAFQLLQSELLKLTRSLKLPQISEADRAAGLVSIDPSELRIAFSTMRLSRSDPRERLLVKTLLSSEDDLGEYPREPMAFPVFGRGRVLYALNGAGINADQIAAAGKALVGECTCQIKEQNPGTDLLMSVDWDHLVTQHEIGRTQPPVLTGLASHTVDRDRSAAAMPGSDRLNVAAKTPGDGAKAANSAAPVNASQSRPAIEGSPGGPIATPAVQATSALNSGGGNVVRNTALAIALCVLAAAAAGVWLLKRIR